MNRTSHRCDECCPKSLNSYLFVSIMAQASVVEMDPLADVISVSKVRAALLARMRARDPWGIAIPDDGCMYAHAVTAGVCWLRIDGRPPIELMPGDVVLLPHGTAHELASGPTGPVQPYDELAQDPAGNGAIELDGPGAATRLICATYTHDRSVAHPLISLLPELIHVPAGGDGGADATEAVLRLLTAELAGRPPGSALVIDRLIDVLFVQLLRSWITEAGSAPDRSWIRALRHPDIMRALELFHGRPAEPWTLERVSAELHMSRATFARRFSDLVGEPPLTYLTRWRMELAASDLRETSDPVSEIAHRVGYTSEYAFTRAFGRSRGTAPTHYRAAHRPPAPATSRAPRNSGSGHRSEYPASATR
jgi:AraC-like DNA-binding protein